MTLRKFHWWIPLAVVLGGAPFAGCFGGSASSQQAENGKLQNADAGVPDDHNDEMSDDGGHQCGCDGGEADDDDDDGGDGDHHDNEDASASDNH